LTAPAVAVASAVTHAPAWFWLQQCPHFCCCSTAALAAILRFAPLWLPCLGSGCSGRSLDLRHQEAGKLLQDRIANHACNASRSHLAWFGLGGSWIFARWTVPRSCEQNATPTLQSGNGGSRMRSGSPSSVRTQSPEQRTSNGCIDRASTQFSGCFDRALSSGCFAQALSLAVASTGHSGAGAPEGVRDQKLGGGGQIP